MSSNTTILTSHPPESFATTIILVLILIASVILNSLFTFVFIRVRYAKDSANYLLLNMAIADLISTVIWLLPAILSAAAWKWLLGNGFCLFQGFISNWCYTVNMHTFLAVSIEKFLRFCHPSKHKEVFYKTVVIVLIFGIWMFDMVIALFPLMGWGIRIFSMPEFQCTLDYKESRSNLAFTFVITFILPLIAGMIFYGLIYSRVRKIRSQVAPGQPLVLEERKDRKETYVEKFNEAQKNYKLFEVTTSVNVVQTPHNQPPPDEDDPGYGTEDSDEDSSKGNQGTNGKQTTTRDYIKKKKSSKFVLKEFDYKLAITVFIAWVVYQLVWLPQIIMSFVWAYNFRPGPAAGAISFFALVSFFSLIVKPIVYVTNKGMRKSIKSALCKGGDTTEITKMQGNNVGVDVQDEAEAAL